MIDKQKNEKLIRAVMLLILICLLFSGYCSVAFGQITRPQDKGYVTGTIFYNDGITPLLVNDSLYASQVELWNVTSNTASILYTDDNGYYTSSGVPAGTYKVYVKYENNYAGETDNFSVIAGQNVTANVKTSRMPTN